MSTLRKLFHYSRERFHPFPWWGLALYISWYSTGQQSLIVFLYSIVFLFSFRLLDDVMCIHFEKSNGEVRYYHHDEELYKKIAFISLLVLFALTFFIFGKIAIIYLTILIFLSFCLYKILKEKYWIQLVSILKYPVIVGMIESHYTVYNSLDKYYFAVSMLIPELLNVKKIISNKTAQVFQCTLLIVLGLVKGI